MVRRYMETNWEMWWNWEDGIGRNVNLRLKDHPARDMPPGTLSWGNSSDCALPLFYAEPPTDESTRRHNIATVVWGLIDGGIPFDEAQSIMAELGLELVRTARALRPETP